LEIKKEEQKSGIRQLEQIMTYKITGFGRSLLAMVVP
jgi:hypothetical protein